MRLYVVFQKDSLCELNDFRKRNCLVFYRMLILWYRSPQAISFQVTELELRIKTIHFLTKWMKILMVHSSIISSSNRSLLLIMKSSSNQVLKTLSKSFLELSTKIQFQIYFNIDIIPNRSLLRSIYSRKFDNIKKSEKACGLF